MPGFDGTGPMREGAMSGGGRGLCNTGGSRIYEGGDAGLRRRQFCRRGFKGRGGGGDGRGAGYNQFLTGPASGEQVVDEAELLKNQADRLQKSLARIQDKLAALNK